MSLLMVRGWASGVLMMLVWLPLGAQSSNYHMERSDLSPGRARIILVNDSKQPIEAFYFLQRCASGGERSSHDALDYPGATSSDIHGVNGRGSQVIGVEPGGRWDAGFLSRSTDKNGEHECVAHIDAVIFADGSYEGNDAVVRGLKARRDGIAASLSYWVERFKEENPSNLASLLAETKRREAEDQMKQYEARQGSAMHHTYDPTRTDEEPLLLEYWEGRYQVESNLKLQFPKELVEDKTSETFQQLAGFLDAWKSKLDSDVSMRKLNAAFPSISEHSGNATNIAAHP